MKCHLLPAALLFVSFSVTSAQEHVHPSAATNEKLGTVHFSTSCNPAVAGEFNRAIELLHSFEFAAAIKGFRSVLATDSTCSMAHWGIAMSRWSNPMAVGNRSAEQLQQGRVEVEAARAVAAHATEREHGYVNAVGQLYDRYETVGQRDRVAAYEGAMAALAASQPADTEATIFHAISLVASASPTDKTYANQRKAGAILEALWKKYPTHPGLAHYIIHAYDYPALAPEAAAAAKEYASIAPSAAHALHMPSHIFTRTGDWRGSIETNLKSIGMAMTTGSIAEALHASDYAEYAYLQRRDIANARKILESLPALAARFDPTAVTGAAPGSAGVFALAAIPARFALEREAWTEAADLKPATTAFPWTEAMTHFARSLGASHIRDFAKAQGSIDSLAAIRDRLAAHDEAYWSEQVAIQRLGAQAWLDLARGNTDSALAHINEAVKREDATEKNAVTPGPLAPARELYGDMLTQLHRPAEALSEYQKTLSKEPNRYRSLAGGMRAAAAAKDRKTEALFKSRLDSLTKSPHA
jgi:tetratricopeptide (TPR) repeat protein